MWRGVVLEESLEDKSLLNMAKIVGTQTSKLEKENKTMTFLKVKVPDTLKEKYIEKAKKTLKPGFYTHLCKNGVMTVIFKDKEFNFRANHPILLKAREYGESVGIIPEQMPFEHLMENPFD